MAGLVPATHPQTAGPPQGLYNRRCVGGRDTPGHDGEREDSAQAGLIVIRMDIAHRADSIALSMGQGLGRPVSG